MNALRWCAALVLVACTADAASAAWYYPPPSESIADQDLREPVEVGLAPAIVDQLQ